MRNQYKVLAEKYGHLQEALSAFDDLINYLVDETEDWELYLNVDAPYEITYPDFVEYVINDSNFNPATKTMWDALPPKEKKRIYQKVIHILAKKYNADDMDWYPDPDIRAKVLPVYKKAAKDSGWDIHNTIPEAKKKQNRDPETIPEVLRDMTEIMNDIEGFEKWFFTHTQYADDYYDEDSLMSVYQARTEDYNEGEGLEWGEAQERVENDFRKWAKQYLKFKLRPVYKKAAKATGWDIQNTL